MGKKPSNAKYCFKDSRDMSNFLRDLSTESLKLKRNKSASDMNEAEKAEEKRKTQDKLRNNLQRQITMNMMNKSFTERLAVVGENSTISEAEHDKEDQ